MKKFDTQFSDEVIFCHVDEAFDKYDKAHKNRLNDVDTLQVVSEFFANLNLVNPY